jgi:hypothetical protein
MKDEGREGSLKMKLKSHVFPNIPTRRRRIRVRTESLYWGNTKWCVKKCQIESCFLGRKRKTDKRGRRQSSYLGLLRRRPEKGRMFQKTRKMMRVVQTRTRSDSSQT